MKTSLGIGYMILSGLFFGGVRFFSKMIVQDIPSMTFTTLRIVIAFMILCVFGWKYVSKITSISLEDRKRIGIISVLGLVSGSIFFTLSVKRTTITNASFLFFLPAVFLPVFGALFNGLKIKVTTYIAMVLCTIGLYFLFDPDIAGTSMIGNTFGLLAGVSNALYILVSKKLSHLPPKLLSISVFSVLALVLMMITLVVEGNQLGSVDAESWKILGYLGGCIAGAYLLMNSALQHISSYLVGVLAIWEPLAATALGVLFLGEVLSTPAIIGLGIILLGFGLISLDKGILGSGGEE